MIGGVRFPPSHDHRPRVLAAIPGVFPSTVINVAKPLMRLHESGAIDLDLSFHFLVRRKQIERADVLVMSHTIDPSHGWILDCAREAGTPLLYDIDENLLEPPPDEPGLDFHRAPGRQAMVRQALSQAAIVRTYAPALARYLQPFNANVVRADGPVEWRLVPSEPPARPSDRVRIVYATSRQHDAIGAVLVQPLERVLDEHANVDVTIWGPRFRELEGHPRVQFREFVRDYDQYFAQFARAGFDIGLAPMRGDVFYQCKTATKFREYAACRIAGVYADTEMYRDCVTAGETGLLATNTDDAWTAAIGRLVADAALRGRIQRRAETYARERYSAARIEGDWCAHIQRTCSASLSGERTAVRGPSDAVVPPADPTAPSYISRAIALLRSGGVTAVGARLRAQLASVRQLLAWQAALRRTQRLRHP
jgi:hypothetical protein